MHCYFLLHSYKISELRIFYTADTKDIKYVSKVMML